MAHTSNPLDSVLYGNDGFDITDEESRRELMRAAREADKDLYEDVLGRYTPSQQKLLRAFVDGQRLGDLAEKLPCEVSTSVAHQQSLELLDGAKETSLSLPAPAPGEVHGDKPVKVDLHITNDPEGKKPVLCYMESSFLNWGKTVLNAPVYTCVPETVYGVQGIVKYAKAHHYGVRVAGYRHSWSSIFGREKEEDKPFILISTLQLDRAILKGQEDGGEPDPNKEAEGVYYGWKVELNKIEQKQDLPDGGALVNVGCSTTNEDFRRWCIEQKKWTLPLNVIMVEITYGGSNAPICHGAGYKTKTLSDLVDEIEYVDANANVQVINSKDKEILAAASGCFGLLGIVTRLTLRLDKMSTANMKPEKLPVLEAIPPPSDMVDMLPDDLKKAYKAYTTEQIGKFVGNFEERALNHYYAEWFWFPFHDHAWVNTWRLANPGATATDYPSKAEIAKQINDSYFLEWLHEYSRQGRLEQPFLKTKALSDAAMQSLPSQQDRSGDIITQLPNALHFRRGIQNFRVRDIEVEIPLPTKATQGGTKVDLDIVRKAWWQAVLVVYSNKETCPMRMPLEMRIMGDSNVLMAPQRGNQHGTCAIEVLTPQYMEAEWKDFAQQVLDEWMKLRTWNGQHLNIRPHWAKEWQQYTVDKKPWLEYLKAVSYKDEIPLFRDALKKIADKHKFSVEQMRKLFSNKLFDQLFFES